MIQGIPVAVEVRIALVFLRHNEGHLIALLDLDRPTDEPEVGEGSGANVIDMENLIVGIPVAVEVGIPLIVFRHSKRQDVAIDE